MQRRPARTRWLRLSVHAGWVAPVALLGFLVSATPQPAAALGLPTITLPGLTTVTLPSLATGTTSTATTGTQPPTTSAADTTTPAAAPPATTPQPSDPAPATGTAAGLSDSHSSVAGAIRLAGGAVSIPVSSVRAPAQLRILLSFAPKLVRRRAQPIAVRARIVDTRGYVIRGARVQLSAGPSGKLKAGKPKLSAKDGLVAFAVRSPAKLRRRANVVLLLRAVDPKAPVATNVSRRARVPSRLPR